MSTDPDRIDGQHLQAPRELGSDQLLSEETHRRIADAIVYWQRAQAEHPCDRR